MNFKSIIRHGFNRLGFDVNRLHQSPSNTFLGLRNLQFGAVIDVGANRGQFSQLASEFFPNAELYCFEPLEQPFRQLTEWAKTRNGRVHCFRLALGEQEGAAEMHMHVQHSPSSSLLAATDNCHQLYPQTQAERMVRIPLSSLDIVFKANLFHLPRPILLKLDVQGFEDRVLRGGANVLSQCKSVVLEICVDSLYEAQAEFSDLVRLLRDHDLFYAGNLNQNYGSNGRVVFLDAVFVRRGDP